LPEIAGGTKEFDAGGAFVVLGGLDVYHAAVLMLLSVAVNQAKDLARCDACIQNDQPAVSADALHAR